MGIDGVVSNISDLEITNLLIVGFLVLSKVGL